MGFLRIATLALYRFACLPGGSFAIREVPVNWDDVIRTEPGHVAGMWLYGPPPSASPGLVNMRGASKCFPGWRMWTGKQIWWNQYYADVTSMIIFPMGFRHPATDGIDADMGMGTSRKIKCANNIANMPQGRPIVLHDWIYYIQHAEKLRDAWITNVSRIALPASFMPDENVAREYAWEYGWKLLGSSFDEGRWSGGGPQACHLVQDPDSGKCVLTFQGSSSMGDWMANFDTKKSHFCGMVDSDETCDMWGTETCKTKKPGGSFVHRGFRNHLRRITHNKAWQENIRPWLPKCSEVHVTGHSLGGSVAALFAACVHRGLKPGDYGYDEDYKFLNWTIAKN